MSSKQSKLALWGYIFFILIEATVLICLIPSSYIDKVVQAEYRLLKKDLGDQQAAAIHKETKEIYIRHVIDTNILQTVRSHLVAENPEFELKGTTWYFDYVDDRIHAIAKAYYSFVSRWVQLTAWAPYFVILFIAAIIDGWTSWQIRRTTFAYMSPLFHTYSIKLTGLFIFGLIALFISPIVLQPYIIPTLFLLSAILLGVFISNLQKRI